MRRFGVVASAAFVAVALDASCSVSTTVSPPAEQPVTSTSISSSTAVASSVAAAPQTSPLAKDWKSYGGTAYFGCPEEFAVSKTALEDIRPKVFDTKTGQLISPAIPAAPAGENITGGGCALSGTVDNLKVVYLVTTVKSAQTPTPDVATTTAYVFDLSSNQPLITKALQPPTPDLKLAAANGWKLAATASGVAWLNAFSDGHAAASPPRTVVLSSTDLSAMWDDPQPGQVWQDVLAFQRNTTVGATSGAELRSPTGASLFQDTDIDTIDAELSDGADKLVKITRREATDTRVVSTTFFDLNSRSVVKVGDSERISGGGLTATLSDGKLFIDARGSNNSQFGFGVWNLRTQQWDLLKTRDEAVKMSISKLAFFQDRLYVTYAAGTLSVIAVPGANEIASNWSARPFGRLSGWTLVCRGETPAGGECKEIVLVQDQDGHFPGPWT